MHHIFKSTLIPFIKMVKVGSRNQTLDSVFFAVIIYGISLCGTNS